MKRILKKAASFFRPIPPSKPVKSYHHANIRKVDELFSVKGKTVLVVGCSTGIDCRLFVEHGARRVDGLDVSEKIGADFPNRKVKYFRCSAENMVGINSGTYDLVYCLATLEHVPDVDRSVREMVKVARPGGHIYAYSAPLWNSSQGHHKANFFEKHPWVHLLLDEGGIVELCLRENIVDKEKGVSMEAHVRYMLNPAFFNKAPSTVYIKAGEGLEDAEVLRNELVFDREELLPDDLYTRLAAKGFSRKELLAKGHLFIARKK